MELHRKYQITPMLLVIMVFLCISCRTNTQPNIQAPVQDAGVDKCIVDLPTSASFQCPPLSKGSDHRAVWNNTSTTKDWYVCFDPDLKKHPFEAYSWDVPSQERQKSGKIRSDITPSSTGYVYYDSPSPCTWPPPTATDTNPKIIIVTN
jgi:hypothetical protein